MTLCARHAHCSVFNARLILLSATVSTVLLLMLDCVLRLLVRVACTHCLVLKVHSNCTAVASHSSSNKHT
jgi:hypothetical protein